MSEPFSSKLTSPFRRFTANREAQQSTSIEELFCSFLPFLSLFLRHWGTKKRVVGKAVVTRKKANFKPRTRDKQTFLSSVELIRCCWFFSSLLFVCCLSGCFCPSSLLLVFSFWVFASVPFHETLLLLLLLLPRLIIFNVAASAAAAADTG